MEKEIKRRKAITAKLEFNYSIGGTDNCLGKRETLVCSTWHMHWTNLSTSTRLSQNVVC